MTEQISITMSAIQLKTWRTQLQQSVVGSTAPLTTSRMRLQASAMLLLLSVASSASAAVAVPDTPAGQVLSAWLDAFNSGDRARATAYVKKYDAKGNVDRMLAFRRDTGGFDLVRIEHAERLAVDFVIKEKAGPTTLLGHLEVKDADPPEVVYFRRQEIPPGMSAADMAVKVDGAARTRVLDGVARRLTEWYVYPDVAKKMIEALRGHQAKGDYDAITDGYKLARAISDDLHAVSRDGHLVVECVPEPLPREERDPPPLDAEPPPVDERMRDHMLRDNCGFEKVERLEGNIGYLKFNFFGRPAVCGPTATAAMNFLAHVDALIVDLRDNGGGDPRMVAWISSYLFDARTHLNDLYERKRNKTVEFWTHGDAPGPKLGGKVPVYVLTAKRTFSGAEEFTYNLKNLKRATIVGETTGGGAHPTAGLRVDDHFIIGVPFARAVNPITRTDWEGSGVAPDVKVAADQALDVAKKLAADAARKQAPRSGKAVSR
jgi:retinol-binding protein 3